MLRRHVTPEGDIILVILTPEGKTRAVARAGVRGPRAARLNLFQHLTFQAYEKPGRDLATLTKVVLEGALPGLAAPERYPYAHLLAELADRLYQEADWVGQDAFTLFAGALRGIARHHDPDRVALVITWKMLALSGLFPRVARCVETGATHDLTRFDAVAGGALHRHQPGGMDVGADVIDELNLVGRGTVREALEDDLDPRAREGLWRALEAYLRHHVGDMNAWGALRHARRANTAEAALATA